MSEENTIVDSPLGKSNFAGSGVSFFNAYKTALFSDIPGLITTALAVFLWLATAWIPYINIWTTLALVGLPLAIARGQKISPVEIFTSARKDKFFDLLLVGALFCAVGLLFEQFRLILEPVFWYWPRPSATATWLYKFLYASRFYWSVLVCTVPKIIAFSAWALAGLFVLDRGMKPYDSFAKSVECTRGKILTIATVLLPVFAAFFINIWWIHRIKYVGWIFAGAVFVMLGAVLLRLLAYLWKELAEPPAETIVIENPEIIS